MGVDGRSVDKPLRVIVIAGPTATGKTRLAVEVAHALGTRILSADSRQVYRGLDIGTGKDLEEYRQVDPPITVELIDVAEPEEIYTLHDYQGACRAALRACQATAPDRPVVLAGGTGLYLEAMIRDYFLATVPEDPAFRQQMMIRDIETLAGELMTFDPELHAKTDQTSKKRIVRSLEVARALRHGQEMQSVPFDVPVHYDVFATHVDRATRISAIDRRLDVRLDSGLIEEVAGLMDRGLGRDRLDMLGMEYREIATYVRGETTREQMITRLGHCIHRLSKRQMSYLRGMERRGIPVTWISPSNSSLVIERARSRTPK